MVTCWLPLAQATVETGCLEVLPGLVETGHPDFVARSRRAPASELTDHEAWCRLWIDAFENPRGVVAHRGE